MLKFSWKGNECKALPSMTAYPRDSHTSGDVAPMPVKRLGESRSCPAASAELNSRGYAHMMVGSGPSRAASYPGVTARVEIESNVSGSSYFSLKR